MESLKKLNLDEKKGILKFGVLKIKFENRNFENYLEIKVWKIKFENRSFESYSKIRVLKITWKLVF